MAKKKAKPKTTASIMFAGFLALLVGVLYACVVLISQPVEEKSQMPKPEDRDPSTVYYVKGSTGDSTTYKKVANKLYMSNPPAIVITEKDLNSWSRFAITGIDTSGKGQLMSITPTAPNFNITEQYIQIGSSIAMPLLAENPVIYQVRGNFQKAGSAVAFVPTEGSLGRLPIPPVPPLQTFLFNLLGKKVLATEEVQKAQEMWASVKSVELKEDALRLSFIN